MFVQMWSIPYTSSMARFTWKSHGSSYMDILREKKNMAAYRVHIPIWQKIQVQVQS